MSLAEYKHKSRKFFAPKKYENAAAIIFAVDHVDHHVQGYGGEDADQVYADITVFNTVDDIDNDTPEIINNAVLEKRRYDDGGQHSMIKELESYQGEEQAFRFAKVKTKSGYNAVVLRALDDAVYDKVEAWVENRDAATDDDLDAI